MDYFQQYESSRNKEQPEIVAAQVIQHSRWTLNERHPFIDPTLRTHPESLSITIRNINILDTFAPNGSTPHLDRPPVFLD